MKIEIAREHKYLTKESNVPQKKEIRVIQIE